MYYVHSLSFRCYITNNTVNMGTTVGLFSLVFLFNMFMFGATIRCVWVLRKSTKVRDSFVLLLKLKFSLSICPVKTQITSITK